MASIQELHWINEVVLKLETTYRWLRAPSLTSVWKCFLVLFTLFLSFIRTASVRIRSPLIFFTTFTIFCAFWNATAFSSPGNFCDSFYPCYSWISALLLLFFYIYDVDFYGMVSKYFHSSRNYRIFAQPLDLAAHFFALLRKRTKSIKNAGTNEFSSTINLPQYRHFTSMKWTALNSTLTCFWMNFNQTLRTNNAITNRIACLLREILLLIKRLPYITKYWVIYSHFTFLIFPHDGEAELPF